MRKNEQVGGCTGAALVLQHARVALPASALDAKFVDSLTVAARHALTSPGMPRLELETNIFVRDIQSNAFPPPILWLSHCHYYLKILAIQVIFH